MNPIDRYESRFRAVLEALRSPDAAWLDLPQLADRAALSPYHWHRLYHQFMGESMAATRRRRRLHRAAWLLRHSSQPIATIAARCGYQNERAFARRFRQSYGQSPQSYRRAPPPSFTIGETERPPLPVALLAHEGDYLRLADSFNALKILLHLRGHYCRDLRAFSLHHPPIFTAHRCWVAMSLAPELIQPPLLGETLPGGRTALLRYHGPYAELDRAAAALLAAYPESRAPLLLEYLDDHHDDPRSCYRVDIYLPLEHS